MKKEFTNLLTRPPRLRYAPLMPKKPTPPNPPTWQRKKSVTVFLDAEEFDLLARLCEERGQTRADFLRAAMHAADRIPATRTEWPLAGAVLEKHKAKVRRERRQAKKAKGD